MQAGSESDSDSSDIDITRSLQRQEPAGAVFRPGMQVTAGRVDTGMAQRCLHKMDGSPAVERVRGVCMPEPMRRHGCFKAGALPCSLHDPPNARLGERLALFPRGKHRIVCRGLSPQPLRLLPHGFGQQDGSGLAAFAQNGDLSAISGRLQVLPEQAGSGLP